MSKIQGFLLHLAISALIVGAALATIFFVWYPTPYFAIAGAFDVVKVLVGVDLVLGPALTLLFYRPGKPGVWFDLGVIAAIQLVALVYGLWTIHSERPLYMIFTVDRFVMLSARDIDPDSLPQAWQRRRPLSGPLYAVATMPEDRDAQQALLFEILDGAPDVEFRPAHWSTLDDKREIVTARIEPLSDLPSGHEAELSGFDDDTVGFVPVTWKVDTAMALIVDKDTALPLGVIDTNPFER
ncbi:MAG: hypothetical protein AAGH76_15765 [Pseudomonadota bacterium]